MSDKRYAVAVDTSKCTGHGRCYSVAPEVFEPDEQGTGVARRPEIGDDLLAAARRGAAACPERAVSISEQSRKGTA
jgi:ferredoxin